MENVIRVLKQYETQEWPIIGFSQPNFQGVETIIPNQTFSSDIYGSIFIPPHKALKLESSAQWIFFSLSEISHHSSLVPIELRPFHQFVQECGILNQSLGFYYGGQYYEIVKDLDPWFEEQCLVPFPNGEIHCECVTTYHQLRKQFPLLEKHLYVNHWNEACNPLKHYVPSEGKTGNLDKAREECTLMFKELMDSKSFPFLDDPKNPKWIQCGSYRFDNVYSWGASGNHGPYEDPMDIMEEKWFVWIHFYSMYIIATIIVTIWIAWAFYHPFPLKKINDHS